MTNIQLITGVITSAVLAVLLGPGLFGWIVFLAVGAGAGILASQMPRGSERVYWVALAAIVLLFVISIIGANLGRLWLIAPVVLAVSYFTARLSLSLQRS